MTPACLGFRSRTAKAIAVALTEEPAFLQRWNLALCDLSIPETSRPHHEVMELPWARAQIEVRRYEKLIEDAATEHLRALLHELRSSGARVASVGVVGSPDRNLERIGNPHIRAHAAEGILYRRAIETAAVRCRLACRAFSDRDFETQAVDALRCTTSRLRSVMAAIGRAAGRPWRADERAAAAAAWIVHGHGS